MLKINVGVFIHKQQGSREKYEIDDPVESGNVTGRIELLKLPHEINARITDMKARAQVQCSRCLKPFIYEIKVPFAEREFIIDLPAQQLEVGEDVYYVDKHTNEIDLTDMVRTELLLHFPLIPLCLPSCKGLCDKCGANLNEKACSCAKPKEGSITPFKFLNS